MTAAGLAVFVLVLISGRAMPKMRSRSLWIVMLREFLDSDVAAPFTTSGGGWTVGAILFFFTLYLQDCCPVSASGSNLLLSPVGGVDPRSSSYAEEFIVLP